MLEVKISVTTPYVDPVTFATFRHEVAICVGMLLERPSQGQTVVLTMDRGQMLSKLVAAQHIDLNNLLQYEMIMFSSTDNAGAQWRHIFFPKQMRNCFVGDTRLTDLGAEYTAQRFAAKVGIHVDIGPWNKIGRRASTSYRAGSLNSSGVPA